MCKLARYSKTLILLPGFILLVLLSACAPVTVTPTVVPTETPTPIPTPTPVPPEPFRIVGYFTDAGVVEAVRFNRLTHINYAFLLPNADGSVGGVSKADQEACRKAVSAETNNKTVAVITATSSEANNNVTVGVGPDKAKWQCLVKNGQVADVMSLTDEGAL